MQWFVLDAKFGGKDIGKELQDALGIRHQLNLVWWVNLQTT